MQSRPTAVSCEPSSISGWEPRSIRRYTLATSCSPTTIEVFDWSSPIGRSPKSGSIPAAGSKRNLPRSAPEATNATRAAPTSPSSHR